MTASRRVLANGRVVTTAQVVSVKRVGLKPTYDLTVEKDHNYFANGIAVHNCEYHECLEMSGKRNGIDYLRFNSQYLNYRHKNFDIYPLGPLKRALRGDTRVIAAVDELGWFPSSSPEEENDLAAIQGEEGEREFANADEVYASLDNSLSTVRVDAYNLYKKNIHHVPTGINLLTSSPFSWKDKICRLLRDSEGSKTMLGMNLPTWEVNPSYTRDHPLIEEAYRKNPIRAERDFGANPPEISSELYAKELVLDLFTGENHHLISTVTIKAKNQPEQLTGRVVTRVSRERWPATVLAIDGGYSNNAFSFTLGHLDQPEGGNPRLIVFTVGEVVPRYNRKVNFVKIYADVIHPLCKSCNVQLLVADRWNSLMLLQSASRDFPKIRAEQYSLKPIDFKSFDLDLIENRAIQLPSLEMEPDVIESVVDYKKAFVNKPVSHLYLQFRTVQLSGGVVTKGDGYTDDIYRSLVLCATVSRKPKVAALMQKDSLQGDDVGSPRTRKILVAGRSAVGRSRR